MQDKKMKKSYFSRFQVKPRRRREGKTDYAKRRKLIRQDVSKYGQSKARLVVRITNSKAICQIFKAYTFGDVMLAQANSTELSKYGITFGLTNYSACYATGLLCGKRALKAVDLESEGNKDVEKYVMVEEVDENDRKAFQAVLDIGLRRATKGARVFALMKGVSDAGVRVPHKPTKFYGSEDDVEGREMRDRIYGKTVSSYMMKLRDEDTEKYKKQFGGYIQKGVEPEKMEEMYGKLFDDIRADCERVEKVRDFDYSSFKRFKKEKLTSEERKERIQLKLKAN